MPKRSGGHSFELPGQCRQILAEKIEDVLPACRDELGVIDTQELTLGVMEAMDREEPAMADWTRRESYAWAIHQQVRYFIRMSKSAFVVHHNDQVEPEREAKSRQRRMVTFRNDSGAIVTKDRLQVTKAEIPMVIREYQGRVAANASVLEWFKQVYNQMELLGLGDDALVGSVVDVDEAA